MDAIFTLFRSLLSGCIGTRGERGSVANQPKTPNRTIRVDDDVWLPAMQKAHDEGRTLTDVIVECLKRFLRD